MRLGVNIDHVATLRQARRGTFPDPLEAALACQRAGAQSIVCHLREDRRHIQDADVVRLRKRLSIPLNLEMSMAADIVSAALRVKPAQVTLVPERRQELTTEGGLDVVRHERRLRELVRRFHHRRIKVSLFIDPHRAQVDAAVRTGIRLVELHTGHYASAKTAAARRRALRALEQGTRQAQRLGLAVAAGHGLDYDNIHPMMAIRGIDEVNIGFSIISRALFVGLERAVREMKGLLRR